MSPFTSNEVAGDEVEIPTLPLFWMLNTDLLFTPLVMVFMSINGKVLVVDDVKDRRASGVVEPMPNPAFERLVVLERGKSTVS